MKKNYGYEAPVRDQEVTLRRLRSAEEPVFQQAMELYRQSFPIHEQRERESQRRIMDEEEYRFELVYRGGKWAGILLCWETERFIYVEHFAVASEARNAGIGAAALKLLAGRGETVILEIDPPQDEISVRRLGFYERAGFAPCAFEHVHPPYHEHTPGHRLVVMSQPEALTEWEYEEFKEYLENKVMAQ